MKRKQPNTPAVTGRQHIAAREELHGFTVPATDSDSPFQEIVDRTSALANSQLPSGRETVVPSLSTVWRGNHDTIPSPPAGVDIKRDAGFKKKVSDMRKWQFQEWVKDQDLPPGFTDDERLAMRDPAWPPAQGFFQLGWQLKLSSKGLETAREALAQPSNDDPDKQPDYNRWLVEVTRLENKFAEMFQAWRDWKTTQEAQVRDG